MTDTKYFRPRGKACGSFTNEEWNTYWAGLTEPERQSLRDKANWEHMSLSAVARCWGASDDRSSQDSDK